MDADSKFLTASLAASVVVANYNPYPKQNTMTSTHISPADSLLQWLISCCHASLLLLLLLLLLQGTSQLRQLFRKAPLEGCRHAVRDEVGLCNHAGQLQCLCYVVAFKRKQIKDDQALLLLLLLLLRARLCR
jgi:hypothetical protein